MTRNFEILQKIANKNGAIGMRLISTSLQGYVIALIGNYFYKFSIFLTKLAFEEKEKCKNFVSTMVKNIYEDP